MNTQVLVALIGGILTMLAAVVGAVVTALVQFAKNRGDLSAAEKASLEARIEDLEAAMHRQQERHEQVVGALRYYIARECKDLTVWLDPGNPVHGFIALLSKDASEGL